MVTECAMCLIMDDKIIPAKTGGFWTPAAALGSVLVDRLRAAGMSLVSEPAVTPGSAKDD